MKEELQSKVDEILAGIHAAAGKASDFALEQLPDIAQSYIAYGRVWAVVNIAISLAAMIGGVFILRNAREFGDSRLDSFFRYCYADYVTAFTVGLVGCLNFIISINGALLVWIAPKVWLLTELARMIK